MEADHNGFGMGEPSFGAGGPPAQGDACRNCGQEGHFSRDCPEPRKSTGACFACGKEGHNKAECPEKENEPCKNCGKEGHKVAQCTEARALDFSHVANKDPEAAWKAVEAADKARDLDDVREAIQVYVKAVPDTTYLQLEQSFRSKGMNTHIIACEKEVTDTFTLMDLQGNLDRQFTVGYYFSENPQRARMKTAWPSNAEENLQRLANAGIQVDRMIPKCSNCEELGHISKSCTQERVERSDRIEIKCVNCEETGHRARDCPQPRKDRFACRNCGESGHKADECTNPRSAANVDCRHCGEKGHFAKDCPTKEKETCRNCGEEGHRAKECENPRNPDLMKCRNCDEMGHMSKECPKPRDYSRVKCNTCGNMGHTSTRCPDANKQAEDATGGMDGFDNPRGDDFRASGDGGFGSGNYDSAPAATGESGMAW